MKKGILFTLLSLIMLGCMVPQKKCQRYFEAAINEKYDVVVVPGTPYEGQPLDRTLKGRIIWSKYLLDHGITKKIMFSGNSVYTPYYEAEIMAQYAMAIGIPDSVILKEMKAEHSTENVYYGYLKSKNLGYEKIALATDPFQTKMTTRFIKKKINGTVGLIPFVIDTLKTLDTENTNPPFDTLAAFNPDFISIKERESFRIRFRGTMGKNINPEFYKDGAID